MTGAGRLALFATVPMLGAISPLLALPAITSSHGAAGWAAVAVGQALGAAFSLLVEAGWGFNGPQLVARAVDPAPLLVRCVYSQATLFVLAAPVLIVVGLLVPSHYPGSTVLAALGAAGVGFSPAWYFVGSAEPLRILLTDSAPRLLAVAVSAVLLLRGAPLWVYPAATVVAALAAPAIALRLARARHERVAVVADLRQQLPALGGRLLVAAHQAFPTVLLGFVVPGAVAVYAAADRLQKMGLTVLMSLPNSLQRWFGAAADEREASNKLRIALLVNGGLGALAGVAFGLFGSLCSRLLFSGEATFGASVAWLAGAAVFLTCLTRVTANLGLVRIAGFRWVSGSAVAALVVVGLGLPLVAPAHGAVGAWSVVATSLAVMLAVQTMALARYTPQAESPTVVPSVDEVQTQ